MQLILAILKKVYKRKNNFQAYLKETRELVK